MHFKLNETQNKNLADADNFLTESRKINIYISSIVILIGLIGNLLTIFVFGQKKFRLNSSHVYLLSLAINDSLFLIIHFFEDTIRTYQDLYQNELSNSYSVNLLNITDHFEITCRLINFLRNVLRFISSYIVVAFTIQRLSIVYKPLSFKFKTKKSAWFTVLFITSVSITINLWVPFLFQIQIKDTSEQYCDINKIYKTAYFRLNIIYTSLIMSLPIFIILVCNSLIIFKTYKDDLKRKHLQNHEKKNSNKIATSNEKKYPLNPIISTRGSSKFKTKPHYMTFEQTISKKTRNSKNYSKKITLILLIISFSLVILNLPYLIVWFIYFCEVAFWQYDESIELNYLFACLQITEIFYVLNYGIKFYVYCTTSSLFNNQLKSANYRLRQKRRKSNFARVLFYTENYNSLKRDVNL